MTKLEYGSRGEEEREEIRRKGAAMRDCPVFLQTAPGIKC